MSNKNSKRKALSDDALGNASGGMPTNNSIQSVVESLSYDVIQELTKHLLESLPLDESQALAGHLR